MATVSLINTPSCPICFTDFVSIDDIFCHPDGGHLHPVCRKCAEIWIKVHLTCPICRKPVPIHTPSWKEKIITELNQIREDTLMGVEFATGMMVFHSGLMTTTLLIDWLLNNITTQKFSSQTTGTFFMDGLTVIAFGATTAIASAVYRHRNN